MTTYLNAATEKRIIVEVQEVRGTTERQIKGKKKIFNQNLG
jgi:hypothetical protein